MIINSSMAKINRIRSHSHEHIEYFNWNMLWSKMLDHLVWNYSLPLHCKHLQKMLWNVFTPALLVFSLSLYIASSSLFLKHIFPYLWLWKLVPSFTQLHTHKISTGISPCSLPQTKISALYV